MGCAKNAMMEKEAEERRKQEAIFEREAKEMIKENNYDTDCPCCEHPLSKTDTKGKECPHCGRPFPWCKEMQE
jgi:hypothetical protein